MTLLAAMFCTMAEKVVSGCPTSLEFLLFPWWMLHKQRSYTVLLVLHQLYWPARQKPLLAGPSWNRIRNRVPWLQWERAKCKHHNQNWRTGLQTPPGPGFSFFSTSLCYLTHPAQTQPHKRIHSYGSIFFVKTHSYVWNQHVFFHV